MRAPIAGALWWAAALVLIGGTFGIVALGERHVGDQTETNDRLAAQSAASDVTLRSRGALIAERGRLRAGLRQLETDAAAPIVARFVRDADCVAQAHHTTISSIAAPGTPTILKDRPRSSDPISLALTVEGRYADVLAVIRALSSASVPAEVDVVSVIRTTQPGPVAIAAALHVVLQRVEPPVPSPDVDARPE